MSKSATVLVRMEPSVKEQAEGIFSSIGVSPSTAVNVFYHQVIRNNGFPFALSAEKPDIPDLDEMTKEEVDLLLSRSDKEIESGKTTPANVVFSQLHEEFGI